MAIQLSQIHSYLDARNGLVALKNSEHVNDYQLQEAIEHLYSRRNVNKMIRTELESDESLGTALYTCARMLEIWIEEDHYESKNESKKKLIGWDLEEMLLNFMTVLMQQDFGYFELTKVVGSMVQFTPYEDYMEGVKRCAEILVKMAEADLFDIVPASDSPRGQICISLPYGFDGAVAEAIDRVKFLPPMVCKPKKIKRNNQSGYLTHDSHRITKRLQRHNKDICLDVLNIVNAVPYSLNMELLQRISDTFKVDEEKDLDVETQRKLWEAHQERTYKTAIEMYALGNKFYEEWFFCYRGRMYDRGYEIHLQGNSFKKAMIDFHEQFETTGWETYAEDFDFELPTIEEEYFSDINENSEVQDSGECMANVSNECPTDVSFTDELQEPTFGSQQTFDYIGHHMGGMSETLPSELPEPTRKEEPVALAETPLF